MTVDQIEDAVTRLPPDGLERFAKWFESYLSDQWDAQIDADISSGKFDAAAKRADEDFEAGRCTPL